LNAEGPEPVAVVIPCFDEAARLDMSALATAIDERREWAFILVDDGSTDATPRLLERLRTEDPQRVVVMRLRRNVGKGEAVRRGMLAALDSGAEIVAYADADVSTPFEELQRLIDRVTLDPRLNVVLGSRFRRLGADVRRSALRHVVGRVYATVASIALGVGVYDTQCGAKAFRRTPHLLHALVVPFDERWTFDVELLSRLTRRAGPGAWSSIVEEPLRVWHARDGSKVRPLDGLRAVLELVRIGYRHRRAQPASAAADSPREPEPPVQG
jgi:glycosyltransferase involved in cell wall biosynthesis